MFREMFSQAEIFSDELLTYTINNTGCAVKIENQSPFALDVFEGTVQVDRINPYSFAVLNNTEYLVKMNRDIKSSNKQDFNFVSFKAVSGDTSQREGQIFNGVANVAGDMNVTGGQIDAFIQGDMNLAPNTKVDANITNAELNVAGNVTATIQNAEIPVSGNVNANITNAEITTTVNNIVETNTNITNATVPIEGDVTAKITNAELKVSGEVAISSGTVNANIENAQIGAEIVNAKLGTNDLILFGEATVDYWTNVINMTQVSLGLNEAGVFNHFIVNVESRYWVEDTNGNEYQIYLPVDISLGENPLLFNGIVTEGIPTVSTQRQNVEYRTDDSGSYPINFYGSVNASLQKAEPVDNITVTLTRRDNLDYNFVRTETIVKVFAYKEESVKEPLKVEVTNMNNLTLDTASYVSAYTDQAIYDQWTLRTFPFNKVLADTLGEFNTTTNAFTAKNTGMYQITAVICYNGITEVGAKASGGIYVNGVRVKYIYHNLLNTSQLSTVNYAMTLKLNKNDVVTIGYAFSDTNNGSQSTNHMNAAQDYTNLQIARIL